MKRSNKKGSMMIYIIIGIVIVGAIGGFFLFSGRDNGGDDFQYQYNNSQGGNENVNVNEDNGNDESNLDGGGNSGGSTNMNLCPGPWNCNAKAQGNGGVCVRSWGGSTDAKAREYALQFCEDGSPLDPTGDGESCSDFAQADCVIENCEYKNFPGRTCEIWLGDQDPSSSSLNENNYIN